MQVETLPIEGLKLITLKLHGDERGFFTERFHAARFEEAGIPNNFLQDNHSRSAPNIIRGLHYQYDKPQGKLVGVTRGRILDVAVDIRADSQTYGKHVAVELSDMNAKLLWIPPGFAHGFCVLGDEPVDMLYKCTALYNAAGEGGIRFDDPELAINWPLVSPIISERDKNLQSFAEYKKSPTRWNNL